VRDVNLSYRSAFSKSPIDTVMFLSNWQCCVLPLRCARIIVTRAHFRHGFAFSNHRQQRGTTTPARFVRARHTGHAQTHGTVTHMHTARGGAAGLRGSRPPAFRLLYTIGYPGCRNRRSRERSQLSETEKPGVCRQQLFPIRGGGAVKSSQEEKPGTALGGGAGRRRRPSPEASSTGRQPGIAAASRQPSGTRAPRAKQSTLRPFPWDRLDPETYFSYAQPPYLK
jgi:hypothetical protein